MKSKSVFSLLLAAVLLISVLAGCSGGTDANTPKPGTAAEATDSPQPSQATAAPQPSEAPTPAAAAKPESEPEAESRPFVLEYPADMQAQGFTTLVLEEMPQNIVALTVAPVLALYEMGAHFVGVVDTVTVTWPDEIMAVSGLVSFNAMSADDFDYESVVNLNPDLVFVSAAGQSAGQTLEDLGIPVYYINSGHTVNISSIEEMTRCIVDAYSVDEASRAKAQEIMGRFDSMRTNALRASEVFSGKTVMVLQSAANAHYIQSSMGTLGTMAAMIGFENVFDEAMMAPLDYEQALDYDPDLVLCVGATDAATHRALMEEAFAENPEYWNAIPAIAEGRVIYMPSSFVSTAGINVVNNVNELIETVAEFYGVDIELER